LPESTGISNTLGKVRDRPQDRPGGDLKYEDLGASTATWC